MMFRVADAWIGTSLKQQLNDLGVSVSSSEVQRSHIRVPVGPEHMEHACPSRHLLQKSA